MEKRNVRDMKSLQMVYGEICTAHHGIADFRAKLLALLPIASGAGLFAILLSDDIRADAMIATGIVAALLVLGLYLYELRGIQRCCALSQYAREIEQCLLGRFSKHGTFAAEEEDTVLLANNTNAALIIYPTQIAAWLFVSVMGGAKLAPTSVWAPGYVFLIPCAIGVLLLIAGYRQTSRSFDQIESRHLKCKPFVVEGDPET